MNQIPIYIPAGPRYPRIGRYASAPVYADNRLQRSNGRYHESVQLAAAIPEPPRYVAPNREAQRVVYASGAQSSRNTVRLIPAAISESVPLRRGGGASGNWSVQVGAFGNQGMARAAADAARGHSRELAAARPAVGAVQQSHATLYRARLTGLSHESAVRACEHLSHGHNCMVVSPNTRS
jgi:hypothetical protein